MSTYTSGLEARKKYKDYCKSVTIFSRFSSISGHLRGSGAGQSWQASLARGSGCGGDGGAGRAYINSRGVTQPTLGLRKRLEGGESDHRV